MRQTIVFSPDPSYMHTFPTMVTLKFVSVAQTIPLNHTLLNPADNANLTSPFAPGDVTSMRRYNHMMAKTVSNSPFLP